MALWYPPTREGGRKRSEPVSIRLTRLEFDQGRLFQLLGLQRFHPEVPKPTQIGATPYAPAIPFCDKPLATVTLKHS